MDMDYVYNADPAADPYDVLSSSDVYGWESDYVTPGLALFFSGLAPYTNFAEYDLADVYLDGDVIIPALFFAKSRLVDASQVAIGVALSNTGDGPGFFNNGPYRDVNNGGPIIAYANLRPGRVDLYTGKLRP
jgi:hypothetical protein